MYASCPRTKAPATNLPSSGTTTRRTRGVSSFTMEDVKEMLTDLKQDENVKSHVWHL
ncbi:unnamed protein product [Larinioides sclopetarius]|uniref:Uncharacterized protein n=1 Tax=Larinioides sclopetarius TaxID=280406 RepID=A0AAV1Z8X6_9ARAC